MAELNETEHCIATVIESERDFNKNTYKAFYQNKPLSLRALYRHFPLFDCYTSNLISTSIIVKNLYFFM